MRLSLFLVIAAVGWSMPTPIVAVARQVEAARPKDPAVAEAVDLLRMQNAGLKVDLLQRLPRPVIAAPPVVQPDAALLMQWTDTYTAMLRPSVRAELHFIRLACEPTDEQRHALAHDAEAVLEDVALQAARRERLVQQRGNQPFLDIQELVREGLAGSVNAHLSPDQRGRYAMEAVRREVARKAAVIECLIADLDRELALSSDQRQKLVRLLNAHWDDAWYVCLYQPMVGRDSAFPLPPSCVLPVLTQHQAEVWRGLEKTPLSSASFLLGLLPVAGDDRPLDEAPSAEARSTPGSDR